MAVSHLFLNVKLSPSFRVDPHLPFRCMSFVQTHGFQSVLRAGFSQCCVWGIVCSMCRIQSVLCVGISLCDVLDSFLVVCSLQPQTFPFRYEHALFRSARHERRGQPMASSFHQSRQQPPMYIYTCKHVRIDTHEVTSCYFLEYRTRPK